LERQARLMAHAGLEITSQTLWDQCWAATRLLEPTYDALFTRLRAGPVIGVDQTGCPDLENKTLPPWQMWCLTAPGVVYHRIGDDKSAATFVDLLGDYHGWVVADALGTHEAAARECRGIKLAACWAHVLRRFREADVDFPEAQIMLAWIQDLSASTSARRAARIGDGCANRSRRPCSRRCVRGCLRSASRRRRTSGALSATRCGSGEGSRPSSRIQRPGSTTMRLNAGCAGR
jgi:hypothetical protein